MAVAAALTLGTGPRRFPGSSRRPSSAVGFAFRVDLTRLRLQGPISVFHRGC